MSSVLRVLLVEDDSWIRTSIEKLLRTTAPEVAVTAVGRGELAISAAARAVPDVALVDLGLPDLPGIEVIRTLRSKHPACAAVAFTVFDDPPTILAALRAGARGYLLKSAPSDRLLASLREARDGGMPLSPMVARLVVETMLGKREQATEVDLTERETALLGLLARGLTYAQCASELGIGIGTVQTYVKSIYGKLDVSSKAEASVIALRLGLVR
jgi:DNA-binding NarL/FixJ family response regulator